MYPHLDLGSSVKTTLIWSCNYVDQSPLQRENCVREGLYTPKAWVVPGMVLPG